MPQRPPLTRARILDAAITLADAGGLDALSMRKLGQALGVRAMSLYNHIANKDALLDALAERVSASLPPPPEGADWRVTLRAHAHALRDALLQHPWAATLLESRTQASTHRAEHIEILLTAFARAGLSPPLAFHTLLTVDSYVYGFALQLQSWSFSPDDHADIVDDYRPRVPDDRFPHLNALMTWFADPAHAPDPTYAEAFDAGLELLLSGVQAALSRA